MTTTTARINLNKKKEKSTSSGLSKLKFMFSKTATKIDKIFTINLTLCSKCQTDGEDFVNFCGLLRKHELYNFPRYLPLLLMLVCKTESLEKKSGEIVGGHGISNAS